MPSMIPHATSPDASDDPGPGIVQDCKARLRALGHSPGLTGKCIRTILHLMAWLSVNGAGIGTLEVRVLHRFLNHDCACPGPRGCRRNLERARWHLLQPLQPVDQARPPGVDHGETSEACGWRQQRRRRRRERGASPAHGGFLVDSRPQARRGRDRVRRASQGWDEPRRPDSEGPPGIDGNELAMAVLPTPGQAAGFTQAGALPAGL